MKSTWLPALIYSVLISVTMIFMLPYKALHDWGVASPVTSWIIQTVVYLGLIIAGIVFYTYNVKWWTGGKTGKILGRTMIISLICLIIEVLVISLAFLIPGFIEGLAKSMHNSLVPTAMVIIRSVSALIALAAFVFLSPPLVYVFIKYTCDSQTKWMKFFHYLRIGIRHWGQLFSLVFVDGLIMLVVCAILFIPAIIIGGAQYFSQIGTFYDDPIGVPSYFVPMMFFVFTITFFVYCYIDLWANTTYYYIYGSIETQEKEKNQITKYEENQTTIHRS